MALTWGEPIVGPVTSGIAFVLDGQPVEVADDGASLLEVLRDRLGRRTRQGRLQPPGPVRVLHGAGRRRAPCGLRDAGPSHRRSVDHHRRGPRPTTSGGRGRRPSAPPAPASAGSARPASCVRLAALRGQGRAGRRIGRGRRRRCSPTSAAAPGGRPSGEAVRQGGRRPTPRPRRDLEAASRRATIEGGVAQRVGPDVALGRGGFADDTRARRTPWSPCGRPTGEWVVGETARRGPRRRGQGAGPPLRPRR